MENKEVISNVENVIYSRDEVFTETLKYFKGDKMSTDAWINKYALKDSDGNLYEKTPVDMHKRLASELARIELNYPNPISEEEIFELIKDFKYLVPQGGPMSGIGNNKQIVSLSNCFVEGTNVYTIDGVKRIEDIKIGDVVNTQTGSLKPVVQLHKNELGNRDIFNLKVYKTPMIGVTGNHKFLSISKEQLEWGLPLQENSVEYLRVGDYIAIPKQNDFKDIMSIDISYYFEKSFNYNGQEYQTSLNDKKIIGSTIWLNNSKVCQKEHAPINREWYINNDFMYFIGLWYGDGCVFSDNKNYGFRNKECKNKSKVRGITFTFGKHEEKIIKFVIEYGEELLGIKPSVNINEKQNTTQIVFNSTLIGIVFEKMFGRFSYGKSLNEMFNTFNDDLVKSLVLGLIDSDGTITKSGDVRVTLANKGLIKSFYHLLRNRGIVVGYSETDKTSRLDFKKCSNLITNSNKKYTDDRILKSINKVESKRYCIEYDGYTLLRIDKKEKSKLSPKFVYTFGVDEIHSYSVEGLISMNCFVVGHPYDSYGAILRTDEEQAQLMKRRGGVGHDLSHIRPSGSSVKNSALTSTGLVSFMERYSNTTREVAQDGRRGALMLSCSVKHPDAESFIDAKLTAGKVTGANISLKITNDFMEAVKNGDGYTQQYPIDSTPTITKTIDPRNIWDKVIFNAWKSAEPGILFWDNIINESIPDCYADQGFKTVSTNPCFPASEYLLTEDGYITFGKLYDNGGKNTVVCDSRISYNDNGVEKPENWVIDNEKFGTINREASHVFLTQADSEIIEIKTNKGFSLKCTPDHHIATTNGMVEANDLTPDDEILISVPTNYGSILGREPESQLEYVGLLMGLITGDGCFDKNRCRVHLDFWGDDKERMKNMVIKGIDFLYNIHGPLKNDRNRDLSKYFVSETDEKTRITSPWLCKYLAMYGFTRETKLEVPEIILRLSRLYTGMFYIAGLMYCDGSVQGNKENGYSIRLSQSSESLLQKVQMVLHSQGIVTSIYKRRDEKFTLLPDGSGNYKEYLTKPQYELITIGGSIVKYRETIGFLGDEIKESKMNVEHNFRVKNSFTDTVVEIIKCDNESVFCIKEDVGRNIIVNGISARRCGEIPLCPYDSCRLLSINLYSYVVNPFTSQAYFDFELFKKHVQIAQRIMDDIIDLELEKIDSISAKLENDPEPEYIKVIERNLWENIKTMAIKGRRTGLGVTAEGDMLAALGLTYGTSEATDFSVEVHKTLAVNAYKSSCYMAQERGSFDIYDWGREQNNPMIKRLCEADSELADLLKIGRRNIALLTIAPAGTTSLMTQTTSGIEPVFLPIYKRRRKINPNDKNVRVDFVDENGDSWEEYLVIHPKFLKWLKIKGYDLDDVKKYDENELKELIKLSPYHNATSADVNWVEKVKMQGRVQQWVDHSISVTVNLPENTTEEIVSKVYLAAWESGCFKSGNDIYTKHGLKDISQIIIGDEVYGHDGRLHKVNDVYDLKEEVRKFTKFKLNGYQSIESTSEHPFLVIELDSNDDKKSWGEKTKRLIWKKADEIKINDHLVVPRTFDNSNENKEILKTLDLTKYLNCEYLVDNDMIYLSRTLPWKDNLKVKAANSNPIPRTVEIDEDLCYFIGWFIAEGHFNSDSYVRLTVNPKTEEHVADEIIRIVNDKFNISGYKKIVESNGGTLLTVEFGSKLLADIMMVFCGQYSENKHLPEWFMNIDNNMLNVMINSHYDGDKGVTISKRLNRELLMVRNYFNQRVYASDNYGQGYEVKLKDSTKETLAKPFEGYYAYRVCNIENYYSDEKVYNFSVEDVDSYIINGLTVHNCKGITVYRDGSRSGVLISNKKQDKTVSDIIKETNAPKRPKKIECDVLRFKNNYEKWIGFTGLYGDDKRPYEIFTGIEESFPIPTYVKNGWIIKEKIKEDNIIVSRYDFLYVDKDGYEQTIKGLNRAFNPIFWNYTRLLSGVLRHGMPIPNVISLVDTLHIDEDGISSWKTGVKRMFKEYIKNGTEVKGGVCPDCGNTKLIYQSGCASCDCGWSKC